MSVMALANRQEMSDVEWETRCNLAALYRILDRLRMTDLIFTHLSARIPDEPECFLINQYGELFDEVTASSLVKMNLDGEVIGSEGAYNEAGFTIHSACYLARENIGAAIHLHTKASIAVASSKSGLLPLSQHSLYVYSDLAYHDYEGPALDLDERESLGRDLGNVENLLLRNHGLLSVGETIPAAFRNAYYLEQSCAIQVAAQSLGDELVMMPDSVVKETGARKMSQFAGKNPGQREWDALVRQLDRAGADFRR